MAINQHIKIDFANPVLLAYADNYKDANYWKQEGHEPVECAFGPDSVVGKYALDHHGKYSGEEPVSIKAARLALAGNRLNSFLAAGMPDPDAVYAILSLSGNIQADLEIASAIAELDLDPIGIDRKKLPYTRNPVFEMLLGTPKRSLEGYVDALKTGIRAYDKMEIDGKTIDDALEYESDRLIRAESEIRLVKGDFGLVVSDGLLDTPHLKRAPIIVQYKPSLQKITLRGCTERAAQRLATKSVYDVLGADGLGVAYKIMDKIVGEGSGGRNDVGGSAHHINATEDQAIEVFSELIKLSEK